MPSQWDHKADKDLLLAIIDDGQLKSIVWPGIAAKMQAKGYTFTHEACRQHFQKIRKESKTGRGSSGISTPPKQASKANGTSTTASGNKRKSTSKSTSFASTNGFSQGGEDDDEEIDTPSKKRKVNANGIKKEEYDGYGQEMPVFKTEKDAKIVNLDDSSLYGSETEI